MKALHAVAILGCVVVMAISMPALSKGANVIAIPEAGGETIVLPHGSPLHFRAFGPEHVVEFDGPIEISGAWYYGSSQIDDGTSDLALYFVPDKESLARLPRFKERGQPGDIYLTNSADLLKAITTKEDRAKAAKRGTKYLSGHVDIWVDKFEAGIECDAPYFNAHFLRIAQPPMRVALTTMPDEGC